MATETIPGGQIEGQHREPRRLSRRAILAGAGTGVLGLLGLALVGRGKDVEKTSSPGIVAKPIVRSGGEQYKVLTPKEFQEFMDEQLRGLSIKTLDGGQSITLESIVSNKPTLLVCFLTGSDSAWAKGALFPAIDKLRPQLEQAGAQAVALGIVYGNYIQSKVKFDVDDLGITPRYPVFIEDKYNGTVTPTTGALVLVDRNANYAGSFNIGQIPEIMAKIASLPKGK